MLCCYKFARSSQKFFAICLYKKILPNYPLNLWGHSLYASVEYAKGAKEPMIVVSNMLFKEPIKIYRKRWGIETLFSCLKTRGFRLEDTHMLDQYKIEKLIFVPAIAFCWAYKVGEIQSQKIAIIIKTHGRKAKSIFRLELSLIRKALFNIDERLEEFILLLSCLKNYPGNEL